MSHDEHQEPALRGWRRWPADLWCPECGGCQSFGPGRLSDDASTEIRTCPEGHQIHRVPYVAAPPREATTFDL